MDDATPGHPVVRIMFVCTAHRVRSPFAEAAARRIVERHGIPVEVCSAGLKKAGRPAIGDMVAVAADRGLDLSGHLSRRLDVSLISNADLIVTMTGEHVVDVVGLDPGAVRRALTLREFAAGATGEGAPVWEPDAVQTWAEVVTDRPIADVLSGDLDVADPIGGPRRGYRRAAALIEDLLEQGFGR